MYKELVVEDISKRTKNRTPISAQALRDTFGSTSNLYRDIKAVLKSLRKEVEDDPDIKTKKITGKILLEHVMAINPIVRCS